MVAFRSVVIPLKAILMNLLSVGAAYGLITLVSLKGWGAGILGFQQVETVEQWVPLFLFAVLFGLSMDYQVFLLSRIKEAWDRTHDNTLAVTEGVNATAGIITGAALIMVAVFAGFAAGDLVMFQQMGFGLAVAVLLDATLIRTIMVPAAMKLLGRWNWYLPSWLEWLPHLSIEGSPGLGTASAPLGGSRRDAERARRLADPGGGASGLSDARAAGPLRPRRPIRRRAKSPSPPARGVRPARERDESADERQRCAGEHRVLVSLSVGVHGLGRDAGRAAAAMREEQAAAEPPELAGGDAAEQGDAEGLAGGAHRPHERARHAELVAAHAAHDGRGIGRAERRHAQPDQPEVRGHLPDRGLLRHRSQEHHAAGDGHHAARRQHARADAVAEAAAEGAEDGHDERLAEDEKAGGRGRQALHDLEVDGGEHADRIQGHVVEERGQVGRSEQPVVDEQVEVQDRRLHAALDDDEAHERRHRQQQ